MRRGVGEKAQNHIRGRTHLRFARGVRCSVIGVAVIGLFSLNGCVKPLFPNQAPRTQYDRYDAVRNQHSPQYVEDEFGRRVPNLRGRLTPKK